MAPRTVANNLCAPKLGTLQFAWTNYMNDQKIEKRHNILHRARFFLLRMQKTVHTCSNHYKTKTRNQLISNECYCLKIQVNKYTCFLRISLFPMLLLMIPYRLQVLLWCKVYLLLHTHISTYGCITCEKKLYFHLFFCSQKRQTTSPH